MDRKKIIIDTDAGIDDAMAIVMALNSPGIEVVAITCVNGNTALTNVVRNVKRILKAVNLENKIPIYSGSSVPIMGTDTYYKDTEKFHGHDGFGDASHPDHVDDIKHEQEHAIHALNRLVKQSPGEITLIALAPLTNIGLAIRLDPEFTTRLAGIYIMGGNIEAQGNTTSCAEFNFISDVEAAFIVLNEAKCPITIVPWETCHRNSVTISWRKEVCSKSNTPCSDLLNRIEAKLLKNIENGEFAHIKTDGYIMYDQIAMAVAIDPKVAKTTERHWASVERYGQITRGQMVLDRNSYTKKKPNADIVVRVDMERLRKIVVNAF